MKIGEIHSDTICLKSIILKNKLLKEIKKNKNFFIPIYILHKKKLYLCQIK